jgi:hypothetical protein
VNRRFIAALRKPISIEITDATNSLFFHRTKFWRAISIPERADSLRSLTHFGEDHMNGSLLFRGVSVLALACTVGGCALTADSPMGDDMSMGSAGKGGNGGSAGNGGAGGSAGSPMQGPDMALPGNSGTLPFAVDTEFVTSGYMGDGETTGPVVMVPSKAGDDTTCSGNRSSSSAVGACHSVVYTPVANGKGGAGVYWQFPANNWGDKPGYALPLGATKVSFMAKGNKGGEIVKFFAGGETGKANQDTVNASIQPTLTADWAPYSLDLAGQSYTQVLGGFGWWMNATDAATSGSFFIDDIQWE